MDDDSHERATIEDFLGDLERQLRDIDERVISSIGHPPGMILTFTEFTAGEVSETRVSTIASFLLMVPKPVASTTSISLFPSNPECYVLWKGDIARKIEALSRDPNYAGMGDRGIKEFWFLTAIALVRCRVLFRSDWFPNAHLRTVSSIRKHAIIFGDDAFIKLRELSRRHDDDKRSPLEIDMQLTQLLVSSALENNYSLSDALELLTTD